MNSVTLVPHCLRAGLLAGGAILFFLSCATNSSLKNFADRVATEVPFGADRDQVLDFLHRHGVREYERTVPPLSAYYLNQPAQNRIVAVIRNVSSSWFVRTDLRGTFIFDEKGKLVSRQVEEVHTGP